MVTWLHDNILKLVPQTLWVESSIRRTQKRTRDGWEAAFTL